jgi:hypothetical protein
MRLETRAIHWLLYTRDCRFAVCERTPRHTGIPDALGVTDARLLVEIEIKRSVSDFRANAHKWHVANRALHIHRWPYQFYFLVPSELVTKVEAMLPEYAGLMTNDEHPLRVVKIAPKNRESKRLSVKECVKLARCMANHSAALMKQADTRAEREQFGNLDLDYTI